MVEPSNAIIVTALMAKPRSKKRPPATIQRGTARSGKGEPEGSADKSALVIYLGRFSTISLSYLLCHTSPKLVRLRLKSACDVNQQPFCEAAIAGIECLNGVKSGHDDTSDRRPL